MCRETQEKEILLEFYYTDRNLMIGVALHFRQPRQVGLPVWKPW